MVQRACKEMSGATNAILKQGLDHPNPIYRFASAYTIGKKKLMWEKELVKLLDDDDLYVQQMSRYSLVELSKKYGVQDFGPLPGTTCEQQTEAMRLWTDWWAKKK